MLLENLTLTPDIVPFVHQGLRYAPHFSWIDYALFVSMLGCSAVIGIYYGCFGTKQSTTTEYLHGGKSMRWFPVAMSLTASNLSGITLLGVPSEVYMSGTQYWACVVSEVVVVLFTIYVFLPVFYKLQLSSAYEYFDRRFEHKIRSLASFLFVVATLHYVPIVIYVPALAFNQVTGISVHLITPAVCLVCIFYTTLGGLKGVVWSDTLQFSVTIGTMATVLIMGTIEAGGFGAVWETARSRDRLEFFNMNLDVTERNTFWSVSIGMAATWLGIFSVAPSSIQRFLAVPSIADAKRSIIMQGIGVIVTKSISCFCGLLIFARYADCDILSTGRIHQSDQLFPYYVMDIAENMPGLPGLFVAGVFSTALSAMSTCLNTLSGTLYTDFISSYMPKDTTEKRKSDIMKVLVITLGAISVGLVFIVENLGGVMQVSVSLHGASTGPLLGLFCLGVLFPIANAKASNFFIILCAVAIIRTIYFLHNVVRGDSSRNNGALYGGIGGAFFGWFIVFGTQFNILKGVIKVVTKSFSVEGCDDTFNMTSMINASTTTIAPEIAQDEAFWLFRISFYYFTVISSCSVVIIGLLVSWATSKDTDPPVHPDLLSPCIYWFMSTKNKPASQTAGQTTKYESVIQDLEQTACLSEKKAIEAGEDNVKKEIL